MSTEVEGDVGMIYYFWYSFPLDHWVAIAMRLSKVVGHHHRYILFFSHLEVAFFLRNCKWRITI